MKEYELTILTQVGQDKLPIELEIYKHAKIKRSSVEVEHNRRLPYPVMAHEFADYWYMDVKAEETQAVALSDKLNARDDVLRHLFVTKEQWPNNN